MIARVSLFLRHLAFLPLLICLHLLLCIGHLITWVFDELAAYHLEAKLYWKDKLR